MHFNKKLSLSTIAIVLVVVACILIDLSFKNWKKQERVIEWDIHWYYSYLPAQFIYDDIALAKSDYRFADNYYLFWPNITPDGKKLTKTTMGMSILYAPFFFVAHAFALVTDYPENGFSEPYKFFLLLSAVFYLIVGLDFLRKILRHYKFYDIHIALTILLVGLGTNLLCYSSQGAPMPHVYNFCLFAIFIYYTILWYQLPSIKNTIILGLLLGLISLIRPSNAVILIFFVFYGISNLAELKQRMIFFRKDCFLLNVIFFVALLVWIPQFIYWKTITGHYFIDSYSDEGFFFNNPKIIDGLFSFRKGWLVYTPMMGFSLIGIFMLKDALKKLRLSIILFFIVNVYIIFSWWCWWYGGTFGQRSMIESYALLALPLASFIKFVSDKKIIYNVLLYCIAVFFIWLNIFQTFQFEYQALHWDGMTKELYFKQFGKLHKIKDFDNYAKGPNYEEAIKGNGLEFKTDDKIRNGKTEQGRKTIHLIAMNNKYVCADGGQKNNVFASKDAASTWETFTLILFEKNDCALQAYNDLFLCDELANQNEITATRTLIGGWETFTMVELGNDYVAFKAANGKYLSINEKTRQLFATGDSPGNNEKFKLITIQKN